MKFKSNMDSLNKILAKRGLEDGGRVHSFLTSEIAKYANPYIPRQSGNLKDTQVTIGPDEIKYYAPYAQKQYYKNTGMGKEGLHNGGLRGKQWIQRSWADHGKDIVKRAIKLAGGK